MTPTSPSSPHIVGFVPAYNAAATVANAVHSLLAQSPEALEVLVIDDASTDGTADAATSAGARVERLKTNSGRGAVRALSMERLHADFIVSLDAGNRVGPDFVARALPCFADPKVAAVVGTWHDPGATACASPNLARRWRARHLFKIERQPKAGEARNLATHCCILRRAAVLDAGNFDPRLRHTEDAMLGWMLEQRGWRIITCSEAHVEPQTEDSLVALAERYWRWHTGTRERWSAGRYIDTIKNSLRVMAPLDLNARDFPALLFTLLIPHWITVLTLTRNLAGKVQK